MMKQREPICGMCWAIRRRRTPLEYDIDRDIWQCRRCRCIVIDPEAGERSPEEVDMMLAQRQAANRERAKEGIPGNPPWRQGLSGGQIHFKGGGSRSGRKTKKPRKPIPWYNTVDRTATE